MAENKDERSLERVGGQQAIMAAVDRFYEKVLADELTRPFFAALDMDAQIKKQIFDKILVQGGRELTVLEFL